MASAETRRCRREALKRAVVFWARLTLMSTSDRGYQIESIQDSRGTHLLTDNLDVVVRFDDGKR